MENEGKVWNTNLATIFPTQMKDKILKTLIQHAEKDKLIWIPSTSGEFSIKANKVEDHSQTRHEWNQIWKLKMHNCHKLQI